MGEGAEVGAKNLMWTSRPATRIEGTDTGVYLMDGDRLVCEASLADGIHIARAMNARELRPTTILDAECDYTFGIDCDYTFSIYSTALSRE